MNVRLSNHPVPCPLVREDPIVVKRHLANQFILSLSPAFNLFVFSTLLDVTKSLFESFLFSLEFEGKLILQRVLHEKSTGHGVDGLFVLLFNIFDV